MSEILALFGFTFNTEAFAGLTSPSEFCVFNTTGVVDAPIDPDALLDLVVDADSFGCAAEFEDGHDRFEPGPLHELHWILRHLTVMLECPEEFLMDQGPPEEFDTNNALLRASTTGTYKEHLTNRITMLVKENAEFFKDILLKNAGVTGPVDESDLVYVRYLQHAHASSMVKCLGLLYGETGIEGVAQVPRAAVKSFKRSELNSAMPPYLSRLYPLSEDDSFYALCAQPIEPPVDVTSDLVLTDAVKETVSVLLEHLTLKEALAATLAI